jgi:predicted alpha/beta-fold hydrolase
MSIEHFKPSFFFRNRHIQTMLTPLTRSVQKISRSKDWLVQNDGVTLHGKLWETPTHRHIIVIFHGLGGHIESAYITGLTHELIKHNFSVLRMSLRGGNDDSAHTYHAGLTDDIRAVVQKLISENYKVSLVGFSLSATMILKWLEQKQSIESAFLVSPAIDLADCVRRLDQRKNRMYQKYFLKKLKKLLDAKIYQHPMELTPYIHEKTYSSIYDFDTHFTARRNGFPSADDYYRMASPHNLAAIENNICIVHSKDDPFIGSKELEQWQSQKKPNVQIHLTNYGGHVGFFKGLKDGYMIDTWASQFFEQTLLSRR